MQLNYLLRICSICKFFQVVQQSLSCTYIDTKTTQVVEDDSFWIQVINMCTDAQSILLLQFLWLLTFFIIKNLERKGIKSSVIYNSSFVSAIRLQTLKVWAMIDECFEHWNPFYWLQILLFQETSYHGDSDEVHGCTLLYIQWCFEQEYEPSLQFFRMKP